MTVHSPSRHAFTLLETLAAVAIIAVLLAVMVPQVANFVATAQLESDKRTLATLNDALTRYKTGGGDITALTMGAPIGNVLNRLQQPINWNGMVHQVMKQGETYASSQILSSGAGKGYRFWSYGTFREGAAGSGAASPVGKFVTLARASNKAAFSPDGLTWTASNLPFSGEWRSVAYGKGRFVAVAFGNSFAYSTDGENWVQGTMPTTADWYYVYFANNRFICLPYTGSTAAYSDDGITWTSTTLPASGRWYGGSYFNGKYIAVRQNSAQTAVSTDGATWTVGGSLPAAIDWRYICVGDGKAVVVSTTSTVAISTDGDNWTSATAITGKSWLCISYGNGTFVATATAGSGPFMSSSNATAWNLGSMPNTGGGAWRTCFSAGKFVGVMDTVPSNNAAYSSDGTTWNVANLPTSAGWTGVIYGE